MRKQSKARNEAFRAAAQNMADRWDYTKTLDPGPLKHYLEDLVARNLDEWTLIWKAARDWTAKKRQAQFDEIEEHLQAARDSAGEVHSELARIQENLERVMGTAKMRLDQIRSQEIALRASQLTTEALRKKLEMQAGIIEQHQRAQGPELIRQTRAVREWKQAHDAALKQACGLQDQVEELQAELEETKKHTTSATWKVFEENERLVAEVRRVTSLRADAEEEVKRLQGEVSTAKEQLAEKRLIETFMLTCGVELVRPGGEHKHLCSEPVHHQGNHRCSQVCSHTWTNYRISKAAPRPLVPCTSGFGAHLCTNLTERGKEYPQKHLCHCGTVWS